MQEKVLYFACHKTTINVNCANSRLNLSRRDRESIRFLLDSGSCKQKLAPGSLHKLKLSLSTIHNRCFLIQVKNWLIQCKYLCKIKSIITSAFPPPQSHIAIHHCNFIILLFTFLQFLLSKPM